MAYTERVVDALAYMFSLHRDQKRKGSDVPYITHTLAVASLTGEYGGDEDQFIAALLHDAVEDAGGLETLEEIRARFGERVAAYVWACTDSSEQPKPPWRERKERYIAHLPEVSPDARLISTADKVHNARTIAADLRRHGPAVWDRFQGKRDGTLWYYRAVLDALRNGWNHPILEELERAVEDLLRTAEKLENQR